MVAAISGSGLGLYNTSATNLNGQGMSGSAPEGKTGEQVYVNTSTGNLILQDDDQLLTADGLNVAIVRTYNSQGTFNGGVGPNWRLGVEESLSGLTGTVNTAGSTITKTFGDGSTVTYSYNSTLGLYTSSAGPAADNTLSYNASSQQWTWTDSTSRTTEVYDNTGRITSTTDASGNAITYGYSGSLLTQITDASGQVTTFTYSNGNITQVATQSNGVTQTLVYYSYDAQGRLSQVKIDLSPQDNSTSDGNTYLTTYTYQGSTDLVSSITQSDGTYVSFTYQQVNGQYQVASYTDGLGHTTTLAYNNAVTGSVTANANTDALDGTGASGQSEAATLNTAPLSTTTTQTTTTTVNLATGALTTPTVGWSGTSLLPANASTAANTSIAYDGSGNAFAVWSSSGNLYAERYASATGTWSAPVLLTTLTATVDSPSLSVDAAGNAVVGWVQSDGTAQSAYVARYSASGGTWSAPVSLESSSNAVATAAGSIVTASNGTFGAAAWVQSDGTVNRLYVARWNGTSWSTAVAVNASNSNASAQPGVSVDGSGNVTAVWQQSNGTANAIYSNRFTASSGTWGGASLLGTSSSTAANNPQIAFDSAGNAFVIWRQGGSLFEKHYTKSSGTWSAQTTLSVNTNTVSAPSLSVDAAGNALAAWIQSNGTTPVVYGARFSASSGTWTTAAPVETSTATLPTTQGDVVTTINGSRAAIGWLQSNAGQNALYAASFNGTIWSSPSLLSPSLGGGAATPSITLDSSGNVSALFQQTDSTSRTWAYLAQLSAATGTWGSATVLATPALANVNTPIVQYDAAGNAIAVWVSGGNLFVDRYARLTATWSAPVLLDTLTATASSPTLAVDAAGNAVIGWVQSNGTAATAYAVRYTAASGTWSAPTALESSSNAVTTANGSIVTAVNGTHAIAAWVQSDGTTNRLYAASWNGTSWSAPTIVDAGNGNAASLPEVSVDAAGNVTVVWQQSNGTASAIYSNQLNAASGTWGGAVQLSNVSSTAANNAQIQMDGSGNAFVIWRQGGSLFERYYSVSTHSWSAQATLSVRTNTISAPSLSVDAAGNAIVAWIQSNGTAAVIYATRYNAASSTWSTAAPVETSTATLPTTQGDVVTAINGNYTSVGWLQSNAGQNAVYASSLIGSTWSAPTLLSPNNGIAASTPSLSVDSNGNLDAVWQQSSSQLGIVYLQHFNTVATPYYTVKASDSWSTIAQTLYGTTNVASVLQSALGSPALVTGEQLSGLPASLSYTSTSTVTVPAYYAVQTNDTWSHITTLLYGTSDPNAVAALEAAVGSPALVAGAQLTGLPATLNYTQGIVAGSSSYLVQPSDTMASITLAVYGTSDPNAVAALNTALGSPTLVAGTQLSVPGTLTYTASAAGSFSTQTQITDPLGFTTTLVNDSQGRLIEIESPAINGSSAETQYTYGSDGKLDQVTQFVDGTARATVYQYDSNGNVLLIRDPDGNTVTRTYDAADQILTNTTYAVADPNGSNPLNTASAMTTWYVYDTSERLRFVLSPTGDVTEYLYDTRGNRTSQLAFTSSQYNVSGLSTTTCPTLAQMTTWAGSQNLTQVDRTDYTYDFRGNLATSTIYSATDSTGAGVTSTGSTTQYVYDQYGNLLQTIDPRTFSTTYAYDGLGRVLTQAQQIASGVTVNTLYQYNSATNTVTTTAANGLVTVSAYNADDELVSQSESASGQSLGTTTYTYDADGRLRTVTNPDGIQTHTLYDADGREVAMVDGNGALTQYVYNAAGQVIETIAYAGAVNTATLADVGGAPANVSLATLITQANTNPTANAISRSVYDAAGRLAYSIDDAGAVTENLYDGAGRVTDVIAYATPVSIAATTGELTPAQVSALVSTSASDRHSRNFYDANGLLVGSLDADGYLTAYQYDAAGQLITETAYATVSNASLRATGTLAQLTPTSAPTQDIVTHYLYDNTGRKVGMVDGDSYLTQTQYDASGNVSATIRYATAVTWSAGATLASLIPAGGSEATQYQYDGDNRVVQETNYQGTVTTYQYDAVGSLISTTAASGTADARTTQTRYNGLGQAIAQLTPQGSALITVGMNQTQINAIWAQYGVTYTYDAAGLRTSATDQNGHTTYFYYDNDGQLRYSVNAAGDVTETQYDALGRVTKQIAYDTAIGTSGLAGGLVASSNIASLVQAVANAQIDSTTTNTYGYDAAGRTQTTTSAEGASTSEQFDAFGDVASTTKAINSTQSVTTNYIYDARGSLLQTTTDPTGIDSIQKQQYDAFGRVTQSTDADGNITNYSYDQLGREVQAQDGLLVNTYTTYDAFARVLSSTDGNGNSTSYSYNDSTRTVTVTTADGITVKTTDNEYGQTAQVIDGNGNTTSYSYDANGDLISTSDALGVQGSETFDASGRLATSTDANGTVANYTYDAANRVLTKVVDPTGLALTTTYHYDAEGRTISTTNTSGVTTTTAYDRDGRVTQVAVDPAGLNLVTTYAYDKAGDVLTVTQGAGSGNPRVTQYTYDTLGRRTAQVVDPGTGNNPATGQPYLNLTTQYRYDANGNLVHKIDANGNSTWYVYDADNRLKYTIDALGGITETDYDGDGNLAVTRRYAAAMTPPASSTDRVLTSQVTPVASSADEVGRSFYNAEGLAEYSIDAAGTVTQRTYDGDGNVIQLRVISGIALTGAYANTAAVTQALAGMATTLGATDRVQWTAYDIRRRAIASIDATGAVTLTQYDGAGNVISSTAYATLITPPTFVTSIGSSGQTITVNGSGVTVASSPSDRTTRFWYDTAGRQVYNLSAAGYLTRTQYNDAAHTQIVTLYAAKPTIPAGVTTTNLINATGGVVVPSSAGTTLSTGQVVGADQTTTTLYDDDGRVSKVTDALGHTQSYTYDALGNKTSYTNQNNQTWTYAYDANGRLIEEDTPYVSVSNVSVSGVALAASAVSVSIVTRMTYDSLGNVKTLTEGIEHYSNGTEDATHDRVTSYGYDALGRQISVTLPAVPVYNGIASDNVDAAGSAVGSDSTFVTPTTQVVYDTLGNEIASRDAAGNWTYKVYDQLGRVTYQIDALNYVTGYTYDAFGNQLTTTRYSNILTGSISGSTLSDLQLSSVNGNVATIAVTNGTGSSTVQVTANSSVDRTITTTYDRDNRVKQVSQPAVYNFVPTPNTAGGSTFTAAPTTFYDYNAFGQAVRTATLTNTNGNPITDPDVNSGANTWAFSYAYYDQVGNKIAAVDAGDFLTTYQYDAQGNLTDQYEYGLALSSASVSAYSAPTTTSSDRETQYQYDQLNRQVTQTLKAVQSSQITTNGSGQLVGSAAAAADVITYYSYDALGNQTSVTTNGATTYTYYDVLGRVIATIAPAANRGDGTTVTPLTLMGRDVLGNLVSQTQYAAGITSMPSAGVAPTLSNTTANANQDRTTIILRDVDGHALRTEQQLTSQNSGEGGAISNIDQYDAYDADGNLVKQYQAANSTDTLVTYYVYDALNRQTDVIAPESVGSTNEVSDQYTQYDGFGEVTAKGTGNYGASKVYSEFFFYDANGRVFLTNTGDGAYRAYLYDLAGDATGKIESQVGGYNLVNVDSQSSAASAYQLYLAGNSTLMFTQTRYDALGNVVEERLPTFSSPTSADVINSGEVQVQNVSGTMYLTWYAPTTTGLVGALMVDGVSKTFGAIPGSGTGASSEVGLALTGLTSGTHTYSIQYTSSGTVVGLATGTFVVGPTLAVTTASTGSVSGVTASFSGSNLVMSWTADAIGLVPTVTILSGSTVIATATGTINESNTVSVTLPAPAAGTYQYVITDAASGVTEAQGTGSITINTLGTSTSLGTTPGTVGNVSSVSSSVSGSTATVSWVADAGVTAPAFAILIGGTWTSYTPTLTEGNVYTVSFVLPAAGTYQYRITDLINGVTEAQGTGTISFTAATSSTSLVNSPATEGTVNSLTTSVSGSTATVNWIADSGVSSTAFAILIGGTWTSYTPTLTEGGTYTVSFPLPAAGTYQYRITDLVNGVTEAQGTGNITFTAATSTTSLSNVSSTTGLVNSVSTFVSGTTATVSWVADSGVTSPGFAILIGGNWTSYTPTLTEGGVCTVSFPLPAAGTYQYRITDLVNGVTEAQGTGTISFTASTTTTSLSNSGSAIGLINSVSTSVSGSTATVNWVADSGVTSPAFAILIGGSWVNYTPTLTEGGVCTVTFPLPAAGTYQYRITDQINGVTEAQGTGSISFTAATSNTTTTGSNTPAAPWYTPIPVSISASVGTQGSGVINSSATPAQSPIYNESGQITDYTDYWSGTDSVSLNWLNLASGTYTVNIYYNTAANSGFGITSIAASKSFSVSGGAAGTFTWTDPSQVDSFAHGGISSISYFQILQGGTVVRDSRNAGVTTTSLSWTAPSDSSFNGALYYRVTGTSTYTLLNASRVGGNFQVALSELAPGNYDFIAQTFQNTSESPTDLSQATGQFNVAANSASILSQTGQAAYLSGVGVSGNTLTWAQAPNSGDTISVTLVGGGTYGLTPSTSNGTNYSASFYGIPSGTYSYTINYTNSGGTVYRQGSGTVSVNTTTTNTPATSSMTAPTQLASVSGFSDLGNGVFGWTTAANAGDSIVFHYKAHGASSWAGTLAVSGSGPYSVNLSSLSGSIDYEIDYTASGAAQPYRVGTGTVTINVNTTAASSSMTAPTQLSSVSGFSDLGNGVFGWTTAANAGDSVVFHYKAHGASSWAGTLPVSGTGPFSVNLSSLSGAIDYEIDYTASGSTQPYRVGSGTVTINVNVTAATSSATAPTQLSAVSGFSDLGNGVFGWTTAANAGDTVVFHYKAHGAASWAGTLAVSGSGPYSVNLSSLSGSVDYEIDYTASGAAQPYRVGRGTVTINVTNTAATSTVNSVTQLLTVGGFADQGNSVYGWTTAANAGDTIVFHYKTSGASTWAGTLPVSGSGPYSVNLSSLSGSIDYEVDYIASGASQPYRVGTGTVTINRTVNDTASLGANTNLLQVSGFSDLGNSKLGWTTAANSGDTIVFHYKLTPTGAWIGTLPVTGSGPYSVNLGSLSGTVYYEVDYIASGQTQPYRVGRGVATLGTSIGDVSDTTSAAFAATAAAPFELQTVDRWGNVTSSTDTAGNTTHYVYNRYNDVIDKIAPSVTIVSVAMQAGGMTGTAATTTGTPTSFNYYDSLGRLIGTQDADGNVTEQTYNLANQVVTQVDPDGGQKAFVYDAFGDQIQVTTQADSTHSYETRNAYDQAGRLTDVEQEMVVGAFAAAASTGAGSVAATGFASDLVARTNLNLIRTSYTYDGAGRRTATTDGAGDVTGTSYDLHGNVIATVTALGATATTRYGFDVNNHELTEQDPNGNTQSWQYDYFGHELSHVDMGGANSTYNYDSASGLLVSMSSTSGSYFAAQNQTYHYDTANHLIEIQDQGDDSLTLYSYDTVGRVMRQVTIDGGLVTADTHTQYDALERTSNISGIGYSVAYSYDAAGNRTHTSATYANAQGGQGTQNLWYGYDSMNRVLISQGINTSGTIGIAPSPGGQGTILTYDWRGDRTSEMTQELGQTPSDNGSEDTFDESYSYTYDGAARLTSTSQQSTDLNNATYDTASGITEERFYDQASRLTKEIDGSISLGGEETIQTNLYNADGTLQSTSTTMGGPSTQQIQSAASASYDAAGNLKTYQFTAYSSGSVSYTGTDTYTYVAGNSYQKQTEIEQLSNGSGVGETDYSYNADQQLVQYTDAQALGNNRYFLNNAQGQTLAVVQGNYGNYAAANTAYSANPAFAQFNAALMTGAANNAGFFFFDSQGNSIGSNGELSGQFGANFDVNFTPITPQYPASVPSQYVVEQGDSLGSISQRLFGDAAYWYIIAQANGLSGAAPASPLQEGTTLTIPNVAVARANNAQSFKPYDVTQALGNQTPTQPAPPPQSGGGGCGAFGMILVAVVAIVVTIYTAGLAAEADASIVGADASAGAATATSTGVFSDGLSALGLTAGATPNIAAAAIGGAVGSAASQGVGIAIGEQSSFSWGQLAVSAIGSAVGAELDTSGVTNLEKGIGIGPGAGQVAANAAISNIVSQGAGVALGLQKSFSWEGVAASAIAAPIANAAGGGIGTAIGGVTNSTVGQFAGEFTSGFVKEAAYQAASGGKLNVTAIAADSFGNALGDAVVGAFQPPAQPSSPPDQLQEVKVTAQRIGTNLQGSTTDNNPANAGSSAGQPSPDQQNATASTFQIVATPGGASAATAPAGTVTGATYTAQGGDGPLAIAAQLNPENPFAAMAYMAATGQMTFNSNANRWMTYAGQDYTADLSNLSDDQIAQLDSLGRQAVSSEAGIDQARAQLAAANAAAAAPSVALPSEWDDNTPVPDFVWGTPAPQAGSATGQILHSLAAAGLILDSPFAMALDRASALSNSWLGTNFDTDRADTLFQAASADLNGNQYAGVATGTLKSLQGAGEIPALAIDSVSRLAEMASGYPLATNLSQTAQAYDRGDIDQSDLLLDIPKNTLLSNPYIGLPVAAFTSAYGLTQAIQNNDLEGGIQNGLNLLMTFGGAKAGGFDNIGLPFMFEGATTTVPGSAEEPSTLAINQIVGEQAERDAAADFSSQGFNVTRRVSLTDGTVRAVGDIALNGDSGATFQIPAGFTAENLLRGPLVDANGNPITSFQLNSQGQAIIEVKTGGATLTTNQANVYPLVQSGGAVGVGARASQAGMAGSLQAVPVIVIRR